MHKTGALAILLRTGFQCVKANSSMLTNGISETCLYKWSIRENESTFDT